MGSCISKCKPNRKKPVKNEEEDDLNLQQDKPIIAVSETQINPPPPLKSPLLLPPHKTLNPNLPLSPISPSNSSSSSISSSFSCTTNHHNSSSSSSSSSTASSSILLSKHKSFKQNPQITLLDPTKKPTSAPPPPHKRQRASSPNLTRQKSFRRDPTLLSHHGNKPSPLRSPSPSRRFVAHKEAMDNLKTSTNNISKVKTFNNVKKGFSDPNSRSRRSFRSPSMRKEAEICSLNRVVSRVNGITIGEERSLKCMQDVEMLPLEDLHNPHIALDCFIFL